MNGEEEKFEQLSMFSQISKGEDRVKKNVEKKTMSVAKAPKLKTKSPTVESKNQSKEKSDMQTADKGIDFEASLTQLETVVKELDGEVKLEQALKLFEEGIKLSVDCEKFIKSAEQKIEILKKQADGSIESESFAHEAEKLLAGE